MCLNLHGSFAECRGSRLFSGGAAIAGMLVLYTAALSPKAFGQNNTPTVTPAQYQQSASAQSYTDPTVPAQQSAAAQGNAAPPAQSQSSSGPSGANSKDIPQQILRTGVRLDETKLSDNSRQMAEILGLLPTLEHIESIRKRSPDAQTRSREDKLDFVIAQSEAMNAIQEADLAVDFVLAEISAETSLYASILGTFTNNRDKAVFRTNAASFITNGILWAVAESLDIPTNKHPNLSVSSGTTGILAGIVPSIASIYALYQLNGKKRTSEVDPNMLAKILDYPVNPEIDYPKPVWQYLDTVPPGDTTCKTRRTQLVDRWVEDKNIPNFTDRSSKRELDVLTASVARKKGLSIATLNARQTMLQQLGSEVMKIKRLLLELTMVVQGEKSL